MPKRGNSIGLAGIILLAALILIGCGPSKKDRQAVVDEVKGCIRSCTQALGQSYRQSRNKLQNCTCGEAAFELLYDETDRKVGLAENGKLTHDLKFRMRGVRVKVSGKGVFKIEAR